jgi:integrase/recombinase XerD
VKINGYGQAKILSESEIREIFALFKLKERTVFSLCLHTGCRVGEAISLQVRDISLKDKMLLFRGENTKTKKTRMVPINGELGMVLREYFLASGIRKGFLFPPHHNVLKDDTKHISRVAMDRKLAKVCQQLGIRGVSTHSFRRTALTRMSNAGIPLRVIQEISGHSTLSSLQKYLGVEPQQLQAAVDAIIRPQDLENPALGRNSFDHL